MQGEPLNILLVEDNPDHTELILRNFEEYGIANNVYHVDNGEDAINYLFRKGKFKNKEKSPKPHLILLDLRLPKVDGLQVLATIKSDKKLKQIPVVILTTSDSEKDLLSAYGHHVNSYLVKPVDFEKFRKLMQDLGFYWLVWNRCSSESEC